MKTLITLLVAALLCGCASAGKNFDSRKITEIKKGETTEADLVRMFGKPAQRIINSETGVMLNWVYVQLNLGAMNTKMFSAMLAPSGTVTNYTYSVSGEHLRDSESSPEVKPVRSPKQQ